MNTMRDTFLAACLLVALWGCGPNLEGYEPREGDVAFQSLPRNALVDAIEGASESPFSHCGVLHKVGDEWVVVEALGRVKETPLATWAAQARDGRMTVYRLKEQYREKIPAFVEAARSYTGRPYDIHYDLDDRAIYCSELVYKAFERTTGEKLGRLQPLGELRWQPHAAVIKQIEGGRLPLERPMITPRGMSEAPQLERVFSTGD